VDWGPFDAFRSSRHLYVTRILVSEYLLVTFERVTCVSMSKNGVMGFYEYNSMLIWNKGRLNLCLRYGDWTSTGIFTLGTS
jgi:hypothetical protein